MDSHSGRSEIAKHLNLAEKLVCLEAVGLGAGAERKSTISFLESHWPRHPVGSKRHTRMLGQFTTLSGGQTGADREALDFAIAHGIPHGG